MKYEQLYFDFYYTVYCNQNAEYNDRTIFHNYIRTFKGL